MLILISLLLFILLIYACLGPLVTWLSIHYFHDYPGPKILYSRAGKNPEEIEGLLVHGASVDARIWRDVLLELSDLPIAAISIGSHEKIPRFANPDVTAAKDLTQALQNFPKLRFIVGHSTAALWMADSYNEAPQLWQNVKIILLAPNAGAATNRKILAILDSKLRHLIPQSYWAFFKTRSCIGGSAHDYQTSSTKYLYGRRFRLGSMRYYKRLLVYMNDPVTRQHFQQFLSSHAPNLKIILSTCDSIVDNTFLKELCQQLNIKTIFSASNHIMVIYDYKTWLQDY